MSISRALLIACGFVLLLFAVFLAEGVILHVDKDYSAIVKPSEDALAYADRLRLECSPFEQMQASLNRFRSFIENERAVFASPKPPSVKPSLPFYIKDSLPENELSVAAADKNGSYKWHIDYKSAEGKNDISRNEEFFRRFIGLFISHQSDLDATFLGRELSKSAKAADIEFEKYLGLKVAKTSFTFLRPGALTAYNGKNSSLGFFWDYVPISKNETAYYFCKLNLSKLSLNTREFALKNAADKGVAAAFYEPEKRLIKANSLYKRLRRQSVIKSIEKLYIQKLSANNALLSAQGSAQLIKMGGFVCAVGRPLYDQKAIPVVIKKLPEDKLWLYSPMQTCIVCICLFALFAVFIQTAVFQRGIKLNVRRVMIICMFVTMLLPILAGQTIFKLVLEEKSTTEKMQLERGITNTLNAIDTGIKLSCSNMIQGYKNAVASAAILNELNSLYEDYDKKWRVNKSIRRVKDVGQSNHKRSKNMLFNIQKRAYAFMANKSEGDKTQKLNTLMFRGPNDWVCTYNHVTEEIHDAGAPKDDWTVSILSLFTQIMSYYFPSKTVEEELKNPKIIGSAAKIGISASSFVGEEIQNWLQQTIGKRTFLEYITHHDRLKVLKSTFGKNYIFTFPVYVKNLKNKAKKIIKYFCAVLWDETLFIEAYLHKVFADLQTLDNKGLGVSDTADNKFSLFSSVVKPPLQLMAYGGAYTDELSSSASPTKDLSSHIISTSRSGQMIKLLSNSVSDKAIYQVMPGRGITLYTIGARQDISYLDEKIKRHKLMFLGVIILFLFFAFFAAFQIGKAFSTPLEHVLWGLNTVESSNYNIKLKDSREDEFGSISRAFNKMVKSLREREFLGSFVSKSVKKLAADPELFRLAKEGHEEAFTVVFMSFTGLAEYAARFDALSVQKKLEYALDIVFKHVERLGGEIDKVIGTKVLIVFKNSVLGKEKAAKAAASLTKTLSKAFGSDKFLHPIFGINSGTVISGIIGAAEVRLDNTIIGDPVNVASRLCALAETAGETTIISGNIQKRLQKDYECILLENQKIRGKRQVVDVFVLRQSKR